MNVRSLGRKCRQCGDLFVDRAWNPARRTHKKTRVFLGKREVWYWLITWLACVGMGAGIMAANPARVASTIISLIFLAFVAYRIEFGIVAMIFLTAGFVYPNAVPQPITAAGKGFQATELLLVFMIVQILARGALERKLDWLKSPITLPVMALWASIMVSIIVSYQLYKMDLMGQWPFREVYNAIRPSFHYLLFFPIAFGIRNERQLKFVLRWLFWLAAVVSILIMIQYFLGAGGRSVFLGTGESTSYTRALGEEGGGVIRTSPPGASLIRLFLLIAMACASQMGSREGRKYFLVAGVIGAGILFTFYRSFWIASILGIAIMWLASGKVAKLRLASYSMAIILLIVIGSGAVAGLAPGSAGRHFTEALSKRFTSMFSKETLSSESLENRYRENREAITQIKLHPVTGMGPGRPIQYMEWIRPGTLTHVIYPIYFMHNSYLEMWMVYGLLGVLCYIWMSVAFLFRCVQLLRRLTNPVWRSFVLAAMASYLGLLQIAVTEPALLHEVYQITTIALMFGVVEAIWRINQSKEKNSATPKAICNAA